MNTQFQQRPPLINVIAWMTLLSGIVNLFWGLAASGSVLATIVGVVCTPITILPAILGVFELIYAAKLISNPPQPVQPSQNIAIFETLCFLTGNIFSMVVGILALVFYNDVVVKDYFARLNGTLVPAPATPMDAPPLPQPEPAPVMPEPPAAPIEESPAPQPEETPVKPRRTPRKIAKK